MKKEMFYCYLKEHQQVVFEIKTAAWSLHESVGQFYDTNLPYGHHLSMVADAVIEYGHELFEDESDILPVIFAAYFHDSIEDARLTYNDLRNIALKYFSEEYSLLAAEIVYALTNNKGRTRSERANAAYYEGIRETPYAPLVKLCDRHANISYSVKGASIGCEHMRQVYAQEWPHFLESITVESDDKRFLLPSTLIKEIELLINIENTID